MTFAELVPFLVASLAIELTPGPNMFYVALLSAQHGRLVGVATIAGVALGLLIIGILALLGVSALVAENRAAYEIIRWTGVAYLLWLAWDTWRDSEIDEVSGHDRGLLIESFWRGVVVNVLNPKAFLFYMTVLPSFVPQDDFGIRTNLFLTLLYVSIATLVHFAIVIGAGSAAGFIQQPERRRALGRIFAALLVGVAIWVAMKTAL